MHSASTRTRTYASRALLLAAGIAALLLTAAPASANPPIAAPPEYAAAASHAALQCDQPNVTDTLLLAEVRAASAFKAGAVSAAGAQGPAQLLPQTWAVYGADDDGNGTASPFDVGDALHALARLNCADSRWLTSTGHSADPVSIIATWYGGRSLVDSPLARDEAQHIWSQR